LMHQCEMWTKNYTPTKSNHDILLVTTMLQMLNSSLESWFKFGSSPR
jgi:hypothetical protein